ncbi:MAG: hypothetical protein U1E93_12580 [Alphaproteobacteria bacterium]
MLRVFDGSEEEDDVELAPAAPDRAGAAGAESRMFAGVVWLAYTTQGVARGRGETRC